MGTCGADLALSLQSRPFPPPFLSPCPPHRHSTAGLGSAPYCALHRPDLSAAFTASLCLCHDCISSPLTFLSRELTALVSYLLEFWPLLFGLVCFFKEGVALQVLIANLPSAFCLASKSSLTASRCLSCFVSLSVSWSCGPAHSWAGCAQT